MSRVSGLTHDDGRSERRSRTRALLLEAAHAEFLQHGYGGTTLASVALRAQVSTATLHKYFSTKRALFGGVMDRFWNGEQAAVPVATGDPAATLHALGEAYARLLLPDETPALFRVVVAEAIQHPELGQELYERGKRPYLARLEAYLENATAQGLLRVEDIPLAVRQFLGMINDVIFWPRMLVAGLTVTPEQAAHVVQSAVRTFLARYAA